MEFLSRYLVILLNLIMKVFGYVIPKFPQRPNLAEVTGDPLEDIVEEVIENENEGDNNDNINDTDNTNDGVADDVADDVNDDVNDDVADDFDDYAAYDLVVVDDDDDVYDGEEQYLPEVTSNSPIIQKFQNGVFPDHLKVIFSYD